MHHGDRSVVVETDYYSIGRIPSVKNQELVGWRPRVDLEPWPIPEPINWREDPFGDRNWFAQFHGWRMMDPYLRAFKVAGDASNLSRIVPWMTAWPDFRKTAPPQEQKTLGALGGMRVTRLALLLDGYRSGALELSGDERDVLYALAEEDAAWLMTPGNIALMNHAYFQVFGLELIGRVLHGEPWADRARDVALETFGRLISAQFTDEGVHVENSPCYHFYALDQIKRAGAMENFSSPELNVLLGRAWDVLPWLSFPDGQYADIGDCTGKGQPLRDAADNTVWLDDTYFGVAPFWRSGYGIVRTLPEVPIDQSSMLLVVGTSMSHTHSHADKLSLELFEFGKRILVDTGKYGYTRDNMRSYVESAVAHNTVGLTTHPVRRADVTLGGTRLSEPRIEEGAFMLGGTVDWSTRHYAFRHERQLTYRPGQSMVIQDTLSSDQWQQYASRLHFDRSLEVKLDGRVLTADIEGHEMRVELVDGDGQVSLHRGEHDPVMGWQSVGYLKMEPTTMVEAICPGQNRTITWLITFS